MPKKKTTEQFIKEVIDLYGDKYDYSNVEYVNKNTKVCIVCPEHGEFHITTNNFLNGHGCSKCNGGIKLTTDEFIEKAKQIHGKKYDYSKVEYVNSHVKVCIICPKHGEFWQIPNDHLNGIGCPYCGNLKKGKYKVSNIEAFAKKSNEVHNNEYNYEKVVYTNNNSKVCIICPKHGEFWQTPHNHLSGCGCPVCNFSKLEKRIKVLLEKNNIKHICQYRNKWLGAQSLDFYLPDYNIAIECQGIEHFKPVDYAGRGEDWSEKQFTYIVERDKLKSAKCKNNNVKLIYFSNIKKENIITEENELLLIINKIKTLINGESN